MKTSKGVEYAIVVRSKEERRQALLPLRTEIAEAAQALGWRRARPIIERYIGVPAPSVHGAWWSRVGKRNGAQLLEALRSAGDDGQMALF